MVERSRRICLSTVEYPPGTGGVAASSSRLAHNLASAGYEVHVATAVERADPASGYDTTLEDGIHVHRVPVAQRFSRDGVFAVRQMVYCLDQQIGFDLFHGYFLAAAYPCVLAAARGGRPRPVIASACGTDVAQLLDQPLSRGLLLPALQKATWITSVNQMYLDRIAEEIDVSGRSTVIRNGVTRRADGRSWQLTPDSRGVVGTVGEFRKVKDLPLLVRAYAAVPQRLRKRLILAGYFTDPDEEQWTKALVDEFALGAEVEQTGRFPHVAVVDHLTRMHVYVQSSGNEGLPNALLEAASLGVPIVATAVGGLREVLTDQDTALLVPHGDPGRLAQAIGRVLSDDGLAAALSAGATRLIDTLSPERERSEWLGLYARLLAST